MRLISVTISGYEAEGIIVVLLKLTKIRRLGFFVFWPPRQKSKIAKKQASDESIQNPLR